jgi:hypothetical protein
MATPKRGVDEAVKMESDGKSGAVQIMKDISVSVDPLACALLAIECFLLCAVVSHTRSYLMPLCLSAQLPVDLMREAKKVTLGFGRKLDDKLCVVLIDGNKKVRLFDTAERNVTSLSNIASYAVLNSEKKMLACHNGNQVYVISTENIENNSYIEMQNQIEWFDFEHVRLMKWINPKILAIVTEKHCYYWDVSKSSNDATQRLRRFDHGLTGSMIDFLVSHNNKYCLLNSDSGLLLFSNDDTSKIDAHAGTFATFRSNAVLIKASGNENAITIHAKELLGGRSDDKPRVWNTTILALEGSRSNRPIHLHCHDGTGFVITNDSIYVVDLLSGVTLTAKKVILGAKERIVRAKGCGKTIHAITKRRILTMTYEKGQEDEKREEREQDAPVSDTLPENVGDFDSASADDIFNTSGARSLQLTPPAAIDSFNLQGTRVFDLEKAPDPHDAPVSETLPENVGDFDSASDDDTSNTSGARSLRLTPPPPAAIDSFNLQGTRVFDLEKAPDPPQGTRAFELAIAPDPPGQKTASPVSSTGSPLRADPPDNASSPSDSSVDQEEKKEEDTVAVEQEERKHRPLEPEEMEPVDLLEPERRNVQEGGNEQHVGDDPEPEEHHPEPGDGTAGRRLNFDADAVPPNPQRAPAPVVDALLTGWTRETHQRGSGRNYYTYLSPANNRFRSLKGAKAFASILREDGVADEAEALVLFDRRGHKK